MALARFPVTPAMNDLFASHISQLQQTYEQAISRIQNDSYRVDGVLIGSGLAHYYFGDDQTIPFRAYGHFNHWLPVNQPDQLLLIRPGRRPGYYQVVPDDFWYEQTIHNAPWWSEHLGDCSRLAFLGENSEFARECGIGPQYINPAALLSRLDYARAYKTPYEISRLRQANRLALAGHQAARQCFLEGGSEYRIHMAFLQACDALESETPYTNIVALDEKAAILHYQNKRRESGDRPDGRSQVLLIDAGCRVSGYCSDVTRTSVRDHTPPLFRSLVGAMEVLQHNLVARVAINLPYAELHRQALAGIVQILVDHEILRCSATTATEASLASLFMPHGVGHLLGIQVHDVGGRQKQAEGGILPPPADAPMLRNTRLMEKHMVFTVEPGLYFIPSLLDQARTDRRARLIDWNLVDSLIPLGGIRIEDNVLVAEQGPVNLTRDEMVH